MSELDPAVAAVIAKDQVREVITRLARGEDRRDAQAINGCFWPDAAADFGIFAGTLDEYLAWVTPGSPAVPLTQHVLGQTLTELSGPVALAETHVTAYHRVDHGTEQHDVVLGGRYLDRLERRDGRWRVLHRTMLYDWCRDLGVAADVSLAVMGAPCSAPHFAGRASGDYSEAFFGG
jgi:hypothetical protein